MKSRKEILPFVLLFSGIAIAIFSVSEWSSFLITNILINKIIGFNGHLNSIDMSVRGALMVVGFIVAISGVVLFKKSNKN